MNKNPIIDFSWSEEQFNRENSPIQRVDNIGMDGSLRFSDIQNTGGNTNNSESIIQFDPKKGLGDREHNPNLIPQQMTSMKH